MIMLINKIILNTYPKVYYGHKVFFFMNIERQYNYNLFDIQINIYLLCFKMFLRQ
jgi:hypothetical protein